MKKVLVTILLLIILVGAGLAAYLKFGLPNVGEAPDLKVEITPERIQHGEYLANHVVVCMDCHSTRDWKKFAGPIEAGSLGKGGELFGKDAGMPGEFYSRNITPFNLKDWTDGEIFRTITTGVDRKGKALFPIMPYLYYGRMDREDIYDIIAYIRSLESIENTVPDHSIDFPMNLIVNTIPAKAELVQKPLKSDTLNYGAYIVNAAGCIECHTKVKSGQIIKELSFSGGREFEMPNGTVRSANITPDKATGIGNWSMEAFLSRFKSMENADSLPLLATDKVNTPMPWVMYAGMDSTDLKAIYVYLRSLPPIVQEVEHFSLRKAQN